MKRVKDSSREIQSSVHIYKRMYQILINCDLPIDVENGLNSYQFIFLSRKIFNFISKIFILYLYVSFSLTEKRQRRFTKNNYHAITPSCVPRRDPIVDQTALDRTTLDRTTLDRNDT